MARLDEILEAAKLTGLVGINPDASPETLDAVKEAEAKGLLRFAFTRPQKVYRLVEAT